MKTRAKIFTKITNFSPYSFQEKVIEAISNNKSVIVRAPTGSVESEAILIPFLFQKNFQNKNFPNQLIYSLPMRVLVEDLGKRFQNYCKNFSDKIKIVIHHGEKPESELFLEDIIVTTIDQTVGAYCCTPLSMDLRSGNIPAGSVSSAFLVFDEIHTYDPEFALQSILILLKHSASLEIPFAILSATLPDSFIEFFKTDHDFQNIPIEIIDVQNEKEIKNREKRKVFINPNLKQSLEEYISRWAIPKNKKIIIVCNTIKRAQEIFDILRKKNKNVFLIHSQFTPQDRKKKEEKISKIFGKESKQKSGLLISTQVIEVGMDISCDLMISEIAPVDSLIQRAGRIARWGGNGELHLVNVNLDKEEKNPYAPYSKELLEKTKTELSKFKETIELSWNTEKKLVNQILGEKFKEYLQSEKRGEILNLLASAVCEGDRELAAISVRGEELTCQIAIHKNPEKLDNQVFYLPRVNIGLFKLKKFFEEICKSKIGEQNIIWEIEEENMVRNQFIDEEPTKFKPVPTEEIKPYKFYVISSDFVKYSPETGLILEKGKSKNFKPLLESKKKEEYKKFTYQKELWQDHALRTLRVFEENFFNQEDFIFSKLAKAWRISKEELVKYLKLAILLHDVGKLNKEWQDKIYEIEGEEWEESKPALAHSSKEKFIGIPHAPISAEIFKGILRGINWPRELIELKRSFLYAISHHHDPRSYRFDKKFQLVKNWQKELKSVKILTTEIEKIKLGERVSLYSCSNLETENGIPYRTYTIFSKFLRLSDRITTNKNL